MQDKVCFVALCFIRNTRTRLCFE